MRIGVARSGDVAQVLADALDGILDANGRGADRDR